MLNFEEEYKTQLPKLNAPSKVKSDIDLDVFDLDNHIIRESYYILSTAGSTKISAARHILLTFEPEDVMVFCGSVASKKAFREFIHTDSIHSDIELFPSALEELKANLEVWDDAEYAWDAKEAKREPNRTFRRPYPMKKPQKFFVFDDVSHNAHIFKNGKTSLQFEYLVQNTRHMGGYIMCCPDMVCLTSIARQQAMNIFFMNGSSQKTINTVFQEFGCGILQKDFHNALETDCFSNKCVVLCPVNKARDAYINMMINAERKTTGKCPVVLKEWAVTSLDRIQRTMFKYSPPIDMLQSDLMIGEHGKKEKKTGKDQKQQRLHVEKSVSESEVDRLRFMCEMYVRWQQESEADKFKRFVRWVDEESQNFECPHVTRCEQGEEWFQCRRDHI